jgi:hypothetical protein
VGASTSWNTKGLFRPVMGLLSEYRETIVEVTKKLDEARAEATEGRRRSTVLRNIQSDYRSISCSQNLGMLIRIMERKHILMFVKSYLNMKHSTTMHYTFLAYILMFVESYFKS